MLGRHAVGFLLFFAACISPGFGQDHSASAAIFSIVGSVRDGNDLHTLENARVELKASEGVPVGSTVTRANGEFEFSGLTQGEYVLAVKAKDYNPLQQTVEVMNTPRESVSLLLTRFGQAAAPGAGATISAHQLSVPYKAQSEFDKGVGLLYDQLEYRESIVEFQRAIQSFPTYYEAFTQEGIAYLSLGETPAAEGAFRKAASLSNGKYPEALILLSGILNDTRQYKEAETTAQEALDDDSSSWRAQFELARAQYELKQVDEAEKNAGQSRDLKPDNPGVHILLANIHMARKDYPAAVTELQAFLKLAPAAPEADAVRTKLDQLQAAVKRESDRSRAATLAKQRAAADSSADADDNSGDADTDSAPDATDPDSSSLPPLPPAPPSRP
ncbi:MAG: carboxypeptidase regulatory-like domain-containing protein [Candidatus Acidiferrales bacterium]